MIFKFKKQWIYYILGIIGFSVLYGYDKFYCLFVLVGVGFGVLLHDRIQETYNDTIDSFFSNESRKRQMKKRLLEQELEKLKQGD